MQNTNDQVLETRKNQYKMRNILDKAKILVIDDFSDFRLSIKAMLTQLGAQHIDQAAHGADAIKDCKTTTYDIILCDYNLGKGQDGQQVLEELHQRNLLQAGSLFIMVTAETSAAKVLSAIEYQPDAYLTKPFTRDQIARRLKRLLVKKETLNNIYQALNAHQTQAALRYCDEVAHQSPEVRYACLRIKSGLLEKSGNKAESLKIYQQVLLEQPLLWAVVGAGRIYYKMGAVPKALKHFQQARKQFDHQVSILDWIARCQQDMARQPEAEKTLLQALGISPKSVTRQTMLGLLSENLLHFDIAQKAFGQALAVGQHSCLIKPSHFRHYFDNTTTLVQQRKGKAQIQLLTSAEIQSENMEKIFHKQPSGLAPNQAALARLFQAGNRREKSISFLKRLNSTLEKTGCELSKENADYIRQTLGSFNKDKYLHPLTRTIYEHIEVKPVSVNQGTKMMEKVKEDKSREIISEHQQAIDINYAGKALAEQQQPIEALSRFRQSIALFPENESYLLNAAQVILENAELKCNNNLLSEARHYIASSASLSPRDKRWEKYQRLKDALPDE